MDNFKILIFLALLNKGNLGYTKDVDIVRNVNIINVKKKDVNWMLKIFQIDI